MESSSYSNLLVIALHYKINTIVNRYVCICLIFLTSLSLAYISSVVVVLATIENLQIVIVSTCDSSNSNCFAIIFPAPLPYCPNFL